MPKIRQKPEKIWKDFCNGVTIGKKTLRCENLFIIAELKRPVIFSTVLLKAIGFIADLLVNTCSIYPDCQLIQVNGVIFKVALNVVTEPE